MHFVYMLITQSSWVHQLKKKHNQQDQKARHRSIEQQQEKYHYLLREYEKLRHRQEYKDLVKGEFSPKEALVLQ